MKAQVGMATLGCLITIHCAGQMILPALKQVEEGVFDRSPEAEKLVHKEFRITSFLYDVRPTYADGAALLSLTLVPTARATYEAYFKLADGELLKLFIHVAEGDKEPAKKEWTIARGMKTRTLRVRMDEPFSLYWKGGGGRGQRQPACSLLLIDKQ